MYSDEPVYKKIMDEARMFAENVVAPNVKESDLTGGFVWNWFRKLGETGLMRAAFPEKYGGKGLGYQAAVIVIEEMSKISGSLGACLAAHMQCACTIYKYGTEDQKQKYFVPAINGKRMLSFAITEENSGSDMLNLSTTADKENDGWVINGEKRWVSNGGEADVYVFSAKTKSRRSRRDVSMFIVERGTEGFTTTSVEHLMGVRNMSVGRVTFDHCILPGENLLGEENCGYDISHDALDDSRLFLSAVALGLAKGAFHKALDYVKERKQYGRAITFYQGVSFPLAEMHTTIVAMESMLSVTAKNMSEGNFSSGDIAALKLFTTENCCKICDRSQQLLGGNGYAAEYELERYMRDSRMLRLAGGTSDICRIIIGNTIIFK